MLRQTLIIFFCGLTLTANSQLKTSPPKFKVNISAMNSAVLFLDRLNLVGVQIVPETKDSLTISVSQGDFSLFDKSLDNVYLIQAVNLGELTVKVYRIKNGSKEAIARKIFKVVLSDEQKTLNSLSTKPNISLGGIQSGRISIDTIKKINCFTINDRYKLISATVYFSGSTGTNCTTTTSINSNCFDTAFRQYWDRVMPGSVITFDRVEIMDNGTKKKYIIPAISYVVIDDKRE